MEWPDTIKRDGCVAHRPEMELAWKEWRFGDRTCSRLAACLERSGGRNVDGVKKWPFHRLADAMLQRARQAGEIEYQKGKWRSLK